MTTAQLKEMGYEVRGNTAVRVAPSRAESKSVITVPPATTEKVKPKTRMPQPKKVSKTEEEYGRLLAPEFPGCKIRNQDVTLRFESGVRYTPDFTVWRGGSLILAVEVKGGYRLGSAGFSRANFLTASVEWRDVEWRHAQKIEGEWVIQTLNKN